MPLQPAWAKPRNVALLIAIYLLVHLGVRLWMGSTLGLDDAEQALFAQHWLPNYRFRAPPLFTWILVAAGDLIGTGILAISLIRYALLAMLFGFIYLTARRLIRDERLAALATYSFTAIYVFGYYSHQRRFLTLAADSPPRPTGDLPGGHQADCGLGQAQPRLTRSLKD